MSRAAVTAATAADALPLPLPTVVFNEVESSGTVAKDWVELKNTGTEPVDMGGWIVKDDNGSRVKAIPAGSTIAPSGYFTFTVDEGPNGFGLGSADQARLFLAHRTTLVDGTNWTAHATTSGAAATTAPARSSRPPHQPPAPPTRARCIGDPNALAVSAAALGATGADADVGLTLALVLVGVGGVLVATRLVRHGAATRQARARPEQGHLRQAATTPPTLSHRPNTRHPALD